MKYINEWSVEVNPIEIKMSGVWRFLNVFRGLGPLCAMSAMIRALRQGKLESKAIPQFVLKIDQVTRITTAQDVVKISGNMANNKRFYRPGQDPNKLYAYGVTNYKEPA